MKNIAITCAALLLVMPVSAEASVVTIDFETDPTTGITPGDNDALTSPYTFDGTGQVEIGLDGNNDLALDTNGDVYFEQTGNETTSGFWGSDGRDTADTSPTDYTSQLGNFFLRSAGLQSNAAQTILLKNIAPTSQAITGVSGEIWDIDGNGSANSEGWTVTAYHYNGSSYDDIWSTVSPEGTNSDAGSLDGRPWLFQVAGLSQGIDLVQISFTGTKDPANVGLALNNYSLTYGLQPAAVPEPSSLILASLCLSVVIGGGVFRRFFRRRSTRCANAPAC